MRTSNPIKISAAGALLAIGLAFTSAVYAEQSPAPERDDAHMGMGMRHGGMMGMQGGMMGQMGQMLEACGNMMQSHGLSP
jgi:hypothetical protein